jgi:protein ImuB
MNYAVLCRARLRPARAAQERSRPLRPPRGARGGRGAQGPGHRGLAGGAGVAPGLAATLAMSRCPGIVLRPRDPGAEVEAHRLLVAAAFTLAPRVESTGAGCCTVDLQGADPARTEALMRLRAAELAGAGLPLRIGAGATPLLASYAARCAEPVLIVRDPGASWRRCPSRLRSPTPEQEEILRGWGIATLGGLTALPKAEVGRRLGAEGVLLWERAAGEAERVLRLVEPARSFAAEWAYEPPVESIEPLFFKLRRFAERVALELRGAGFVAEKLSLTLLLEDETDHRREFRLPEPGADVEGWLRVLGAHLEGVRTDARVAGVRLVAAPARPPQRQEGLFDTGLRDPASFWENLARVAAIVGDDRVGTPVPADTHRPDAFVWRGPPRPWPPRRAPVHPPCGPALRRFRPPWPVRVVCEAGAARPAGGRAAGGRVRAALGPWRGAGDWWKPGVGRRDLAGRAGRRAASTSSPARRTAGASRGCWTSRTGARLPMPYVELHARSAFSFLRGGSLPEALVAEAGRLGMPALALCDRDGVYGAVRLHMAGREAGVRALVGCELTMEDGSVVPVLVATRAGYRNLCGLLTTAHLRAEKGEGRVAWGELAEAARGSVALTGDEEGPVRRAWLERGPAAAAEAGGRLAGSSGDRLHVEIQRHRIPARSAGTGSWSTGRAPRGCRSWRRTASSTRRRRLRRRRRVHLPAPPHDARRGGPAPGPQPRAPPEGRGDGRNCSRTCRRPSRTRGGSRSGSSSRSRTWDTGSPTTRAGRRVAGLVPAEDDATSGPSSATAAWWARCGASWSASSRSSRSWASAGIS